MDGWIKIYRKLLDWGWYTDSHMVHLFVHFLLKANTEDKCWRGITIPRGSFVTGREILSEETGISQQSIRTCIQRLIDTGEITKKSTNKFTIITVCNYESYQQVPDSVQPTTNQQLTNNQPTTNHNIRIIRNKEDKEKYKKESGEGVVQDLFQDSDKPAKPKPPARGPVKHRYAPDVLMTEMEYSTLVQKYGQDGADWMIKKLDDYKAACGRTYKSDYRAILNWVVKEYQKQTNQMNYGTSEINRQYNQADAQRQRDAEFADYLAKKLGGDGVR